MQDKPDPSGLPSRAVSGGLAARLDRMGPTVRGMLWAVAAGLIFSVLNATIRGLARDLDPMQTQFLRYLFGLVVMLPFVFRSGLAAYRPNGLAGQFWRGVVHTAGLAFWFTALPHLTLADMTAIGFTTPIFIMIGAALVLREQVSGARWFAALVGFSGVLIVVGPQFSGGLGFYSLVMLASAPMFAASFLITKALTKRDSAEVIVTWQNIAVSLLTLPLAIPGWVQPSAAQWGLFLIAGVLGSGGHYCLTRAFRSADISATQSVRFLDLIWASVMGILVFGDWPSQWTLLGGLVIFTSTMWIARHEARKR
ncbi:MAG: hypothetical protein RIS35_1546 [Pseudomonadota bacterium]|jgi:drug/metabolite transporter (DMT)-like permease